MNARRRVPAGLAVAAALLIAACGGGGGDGGGGGNNPAPLVITNTTLNDGVVGLPYQGQAVATGGTGTRTFSLTGSLPGGLTLDAGTGVISGTPSGSAGETSITVTVTDSGSPAQSDSQAFTLRLADVLAADSGTPPLAVIGAPYSHVITLSGGIPPYEVSAALPDGLSINASGVISGTPTSAARTTVEGGLAVLDSASPRQQFGAPLRVPVQLEVATSALPDATGGVYYSAQLQTQGGLPAFDWEMTGGNIPFLVRGSGFIDGTPDATCTPSFSTLDVRVTDADTPAQVATRAGITLTVNPGVLSIPASTAPPVGTIGQPYVFGIAVTPGAPPYVYSVTAGSLPAGLTLDASGGWLSGTPAANGTFNFTIQVTDDCGATASRAFSIIVRNLPQGRNDSIATATPIGNGTIVASISPSGHPNTVFAPDQDYYVVQTTAQSTITVDLSAVSGGVDTVIELVDSTGTRLQACGPTFNEECMNDDRQPGNLDSLLEAQIGGPATFYIRVVEWRGDGRPDLRYRLLLSGVN